MDTREQTERGLRIINYDPAYRKDFIELNEHWVRKHFEMENTDRRLLHDLERTILEPGGDIVFVLRGDECVGACALVNEGGDLFELVKMAVRESERGRGLGNILMEATLDRARELGATRVYLRSNTKLEAAINLYRKYGFTTVRLGPHEDYARADIEMAIDLTD